MDLITCHLSPPSLTPHPRHHPGKAGEGAFADVVGGGEAEAEEAGCFEDRAGEGQDAVLGQAAGEGDIVR